MKKFYILILTVFIGVTMYSQSIYDGLLFFYNFDGNTQDCWVNEFNGINYRAELTYDRFENPAGAYYFDGETAYIEFPDDPLLKPELPVSFSAWVNFEEATATTSSFFTSDYWPCYYSGVWSTISSTGKVGISFGTGEFIGPYARCSKVGQNTTINPNQWYHIVGVIKGKDDMEIYVNSVNDGGDYTGTGPDYLKYSAGPGCIGRKVGNYESPPARFKGSIDEVGYWNRALTQSDVDTLFNNEICISTDIFQKKYSINIYPNPSSTSVNVDISNYNTLGSLKIEIYNSLGQKVHSSMVLSEKTILSKKHFKGKGLFIIKLVDNDSRFTETKEVIIK